MGMFYSAVSVGSPTDTKSSLFIPYRWDLPITMLLQLTDDEVHCFSKDRQDKHHRHAGCPGRGQWHLFSNEVGTRAAMENQQRKEEVQGPSSPNF